MNLQRSAARRGQPLVALALVLLGWAGARSFLWATAYDPAAGERGAMARRGVVKPANPPAPAQGAHRIQQRGKQSLQPLRRPTTVVPLDPAGAPVVRPKTAVPARIAAAHQLLFQAGTATFPATPDELAAGTVPPALTPTAPPLALRRQRLSRWSADGWVLWRQGGNGYNLPGRGLPGAILYSGAYGASQAGLVLRYRMARDSGHRPALYLRASSGYDRPRGEELAAGLALRPIASLPLAVMGEVRATRIIDATTVRPAAAVVTELPAKDLPFDLRGEIYAQAGWVGGRSKTAFLDGQARIDRRVGGLDKAELRLGVAGWIGAQRGTNRLDLGPSLRLDLPVAGVNARLSADYRMRVAGSAAPGNGLAVTFSAGF